MNSKKDMVIKSLKRAISSKRKSQLEKEIKINLEKIDEINLQKRRIEKKLEEIVDELDYLEEYYENI